MHVERERELARDACEARERGKSCMLRERESMRERLTGNEMHGKREREGVGKRCMLREKGVGKRCM